MDWAPGDLALCIREGSWLEHGVGPKRGEIHRVLNVLTRDEVIPIGVNRDNTCFLEFTPWYPLNTFGDSNFTKVTPLDPDEFDLEVITDLVCVPSPVFTEISGKVTSRPAASSRRPDHSPNVADGGSVLSQALDHSSSRNPNGHGPASSLLGLHAGAPTAGAQHDHG